MTQNTEHRYWCHEHNFGPHPLVPATEENLLSEIAEHSPPGYWGFLADEWSKLRRQGQPPCTIDYDSCHVFR